MSSSCGSAPRHVHAALDQAPHQLRIGSRLRWQGDHDAGFPVSGYRPEQVDRAASQQLSTFVGAYGGGYRRLPAVLEHRQHRGANKPQGGLHMGFTATQRGQPETG